MRWPLGAVSDIAEIISGYAFKSEWFGSGFDKVIRIGDLQDGRVQLDSALCVDAKINNVSSQFKILPKDILMALSGATVGKIAIAQERDAGAYINQRVAIIRGKTPEAAEFLKYVFSGALQEKLLLSAGGAAQPNLSPKSLALMEIPLPPLSEQKRIAAILDKADSIRRKRQQAIKLADEFLRSVFLDMFGDPVTNPKGWDRKELGDYIAEGDRINYGIVQPGDEVENGVPIVRVGDFKSGKIDKSNLKRVSLDIDKKHLKSKLVGDEILIACVGATAGKVALADMSLSGFNTVRAVTRVRLNEKVNRHYFFRYLQSPFVQQYFQKQLRTVGQPTLNGTQIAQTPILIPDVKHQQKYLEVATKVDLWISSIEDQNNQLTTFIGSLTQKAFSGSL
ncbi:MAG: restriction endonuclease subunit S [Agitococcus sp.]|nr:restriction endonuclease subunit S [Agitococcus sp.]